MNKYLLIIFVILSSINIRSQDYFFKFVDGWINNYCVEMDDEYLFLGLGSGDGPLQHFFLYNQLDTGGDIIDQSVLQLDSTFAESSRDEAQMATFLDEENLLVTGVIVMGLAEEFIGTVVKYNLITKEFELMISEYDVIFSNVILPNDSTILVAGDRNYDGAGINNYTTKFYNYDLDGEIRWSKTFNCESICNTNPKHILPLANGNIALLMSEYDFGFPTLYRREKAILVVMNPEGDVLWEAFPGDEEGHRVWAGGIVEVDDEIMVSFTEPYYYQPDGEWDNDFDNTFNLEKYNTDSGTLTWSADLLDYVQYELDDYVPGAIHRVTQMQYLNDGNILLSGTTAIMGLMVKIDTEGNVIWHQAYAPHPHYGWTEKLQLNLHIY